MIWQPEALMGLLDVAVVAAGEAERSAQPAVRNRRHPFPSVIGLVLVLRVAPLQLEIPIISGRLVGMLRGATNEEVVVGNHVGLSRATIRLWSTGSVESTSRHTVSPDTLRRRLFLQPREVTHTTERVIGIVVPYFLCRVLSSY